MFFTFCMFCHALVGAGSFTIGSADGSFEAGLDGITTTGDVRLLSSLGSLRPTRGRQAVVLTTAPDAGAERVHADVSVLRFDPMAIPAATPQLRLDYVFLSNERAPSYTNDKFTVSLALIAGGEETLLQVDTFDPPYPAPWTGYARQTGFRTLLADLSAYAGSGETVSFELRLSDVGDGRGDSAVFVDNMQLTAPTEPVACVHSVYQVLQAGDTLFADASCSSDSDDLIVEYRWDLGDGTKRIGRFIEHTYAADGIYQVSLTVKDEAGNSSTATFHVAVGATNHAPQIVSPPVILAANDTPYRYDVGVDDPEVAFGDGLTFALTAAPAGMSIDPATGAISWTPSASDARQNPVTVTVTDRLGLSDTQSFTVTVDAEIYIVASDDIGRLYAARSNGDGTFADYRFIDDIGRRTRGVALADFDHDGDFDILSGSAQGDTLTLYYLEKQGSRFAAPVEIATLGDSATPAGDILLDMAAADFNDDGDMDAVLNSNGPHSWLLLNRGQLTFADATFYGADFESDADSWGTATCNSALTRDNSTAGSGAWSMQVSATADDACLAGAVSPGGWQLTQGPTLSLRYRIPPGTPAGLRVFVTGYGWLLLGGSPAASPGTTPTVSAVNLIDDDQWHQVTLDLYNSVRQQWPEAIAISSLGWWSDSNATAGAHFWFDDVQVTRRTYASGFDISLLPGSGGSGRGLDAADVNGDGYPDIARGRCCDGLIELYPGDGTGQFTTSTPVDAGSDPYGLVLADIDTDGVIDLLTQSASATARFFQGNGDGTFQPGVTVTSLDTNNYTAFAAFDLNQDGARDLVAVTYTFKQVWFYPGNGDATFGPRSLIGTTSGNALGIAVPAGRVPGQPVSLIAVDADTVNMGGSIAFDASSSYDDGSILDYHWDFGDGATASGAIASHLYNSEGVYRVVLTITDDDGHIDRSSRRIVVNGAPPVANAGGPYVVSEANAIHGKWPVALDGSAASDAESGISSYTWDIDASDGIGTDGTGPTLRHVYTTPGVYTVTLTVTDGAGQTDTATTRVTVTAGATPVAALNGPLVLDESAASLGSWTMRADLSSTSDDLAIASYSVDWGDNTQTTISALRDTFEDGDLDSNPVWTANGGSWRVINGELRQSDTSSGWKWLQALSTSYRDFVLQLDVNGVSSGGQIGIAFHNANLSGSSDTFLLSSADADNNWRFTDGSGNTVLATGGSGWDPGIWYHLRLVVSGNTMQLFVTPAGGSETLQLEATDPHHPSGGIGLLANAQHVIFDNVEVTPSGDSLQPVHLYTATGDYTLTLTATDHAAQSASASFTTSVIANAPPMANAGGPYVLTEADAFGGAWVFSPDASASSDDYGIFDYLWDFGDGSSGSGVNPTHVYTTPGTYTVTLTVTDHAGQQHSTTAAVEIAAGSPPLANAGGPYVFGEDAATLGLWAASFDASGSSDDVGIDRYEWWLAASDDFTGTAIDADTWQASPDVTQDDAVTITGISPWGQRYLFSTDAHYGVFQAQVRPVNTSGFQFAMWGMRRADASTFSYTSMPYAIYFHGSDIQVYEDGAARGSFATYTRGDLYDIRITVKPGGTGAVYEFKPAEDAAWTLLYDSDHPTSVPLQVGGTVASGTFVIDNVQRTRIYSGPTLSQSYTHPGVHNLTLKVWDRAGQPASDTTTVTIAPGAPPVADAGGPYILLHDRRVAFSSAAASDDTGIARYRWDFGDGSATAKPNPVHLYATPDTYTVTLTVTDNALQTSSATTTVQPGQVSQVDSAGLSGDWQTLAVGGTLTAQIDNPGSTDMGPFTVIFFEDLDGDGRFGAGIDTTLGSAAYTGLAAGAALPVSAAASGTVRFRQPVISAFLDTGAAGDASDAAHYGDSRQACTLAPQIGQFNPVVEWQWAGDAVNASSDGVIMAPAVIDLTADGIPDVVFASVAGVPFSAGILRAISGADGSPLFTVTNPGVYGIGQLAVGDIDLDGRPEIIAVDSSGSGLVAFEHDGTVKWQSAALTQPINWGGPAIADLDHDGTPEIVVGASVFNADGSLRWSGTPGRGEHPNGLGPLSLVADLDGQGGAEVVAGNTAYYADGTVYWHNASLGDGFNAVGNFDFDAFPEVVLVSDGKVYLLEHDGSLKWGPVVLAGNLEGGAPTVADVDGDGEPEIGVATGSAYTVLETDGTIKWSQPIQDLSSHVTGSSVFDFEGDGRAEIVYGDETTLRIFRGTDGTVLWQTPSRSSTGYELPVIADVDGDGQAEIVKVSDYASLGAGIQVFGDANQSWVGARPLWNQHTYHVTNINDDGSIPQYETPSWQTHNSYRRNLLSVGDALRFADLTASYVRINVQGGVAQVTARIGNGGAFAVPPAVPVAFYDGDPDTGGTLLGMVATATELAPNAFEDVTLPVTAETVNPLWVVVDEEGTVAECDAANNRHNSGLLVQLNQPPLAAAGGPYTGQEGVALTLDGSGSSDPDGQALTYAWDLDGDGAFDDASGATPTVTFQDDGTYTITLQVADGSETHTDTAVVTVSNAAPVVDAGGPLSLDEGSALTRAGSFSDRGADSWTATVDYGDGSGAQPLSLNADNTFSLSHTYADDGAYTVVVTVSDDDGGIGNATATISVINTPPVVLAGPEQRIIEGVSINLAPATYTDAGLSDTHSATINWGDGIIENGTLTAAGSSGTVSGTHLYDDNGAFTVMVCVSDNDAATGCGTLDVTVSNSQPAVTLDATDAAALLPGGASFFVRRVSVSRIYSATGTDAGSDDLTFTWHWGDSDVLSHNTHFNNGDSADGRPPSNRGATAPFSATDSASHTYTTPGAYTLSVHLTDDDVADSGQSPTTAALPTLITDRQDCSMTIGFWQHQFDPATSKPQVNAATRQAYLSLLSQGSHIFSEIFPASTSTDAWLILQPDDTNATTIQGQAIEQALAAWLNFARGAVGWNATIAGLSRPFDQVMAEIETVFLTPNPIKADYVRANDLAVAINEMDAKNKDCKQR